MTYILNNIIYTSYFIKMTAFNINHISDINKDISSFTIEITHSIK